MLADVSKLSNEGTGFESLRVDHWNGNGRHWVTYFRENDDGLWEPYTTAVTPVTHRRDGFDQQGLDTAFKVLEEKGYETADFE